jgi:alpha-mannosidase
MLNVLFLVLLKVTASVEQSYGFYSGNIGDDKDSQVVICTQKIHCRSISCHNQNIVFDCKLCFFIKASGAYVFRPNGSFPIKSDHQVTVFSFQQLMMIFVYD